MTDDSTNDAPRYLTVRAPSGRVLRCERLVIEGSRVKILRRYNTHRDLMIGVRQLAALVRAGWKFDEVWVECFPDEDVEAERRPHVGEASPSS
jgi:hypothetical protein